MIETIKSMIKNSLHISILITFFFFLAPFNKSYASKTTWQIQSIDTMKTSRDLTLYKQNDASFDREIHKELSSIKAMGANYVTIDGAYDTSYIPWMKRWVNSARKKGLHKWFRGNFSGWHGWFGPKDMTREEHIQALKSFIISNADLFQDGDSFTACPECEYGGAGNPLDTKDFKGFRKFMLDEYEVMNDSFSKIHKKVYTNWFSMNPDIANEILDTETVNKIGNIITLDYYVKDPQELDKGINFFLNKFPNAKILIGEFGAPLPAINGTMTEKEQAQFIEKILMHLYNYKDKIIGINYWVSYYGDTSLLHSDYTPKTAFSTVKSYFIPAIIKGTVVNQLGEILTDVKIETSNGFLSTKTDKDGRYLLTVVSHEANITAGNNEYITTSAEIKNLTSGSETIQNFTLIPIHQNLLYRIRMFLYSIGKK